MEIQIIKKESISTQNVEPINTTVTKYEIMDGGPIKNETIPIRFFLKPYDLTPTFKSINNKFSVQYFINLVLTDVEDRKYFKQHEIFMFRIDKNKKPIVEPGKNPYQDFVGMAANMLNPNLLLNPSVTQQSGLIKQSKPFSLTSKSSKFEFTKSWSSPNVDASTANEYSASCFKAA